MTVIVRPHTMRAGYLRALLLVLLVAGCAERDREASIVTNQEEAVYAIALTVATPSNLPRCNSALAGTTAFVQTPASLFNCVAGLWVPVPCNIALGGAVAYASGEKFLLACSAGRWTQVALPAGAPGPQGDAGAVGAQGPAGAPGTLVSIQPESAGARCETGGQRIEAGSDANRNGLLDSAEVQNTQYVCNGAVGPRGPAGTSGVVAVTAIAAGAQCGSGGVRLDFGLDGNGSGTLEPAEINGSSYLCNGAPGAMGSPGTPGMNGASSLVSGSSEPPGSQCAAGGVRLRFGLDSDGDGTLEASEVSATSFVCNGPSNSGADAGTGAIDSGSDAAREATLTGITPQSSLVAPGGAVSLTVELARPAGPQGETISFQVLPLGSGTVPATVFVPAGATSAAFSYTNALFDGTVVATLGDTSTSAEVRVMIRGLTGITPQSSLVAPGGAVSLTVELTLPARPQGETISLQVLPAGSGSLPATVFVPAGALSATFSYTNALFDGTVVATLADSSTSAEVLVIDGPL